MVEKKEAPAKTTRAPRKTAAKTAPNLEEVVHMEEVNARHISENTKEIKNNSNMLHLLYGVIILLMLVIAGLAFYVGSMMGTWSTTSWVTQASDIEIVVYDDIRCTDCQTSDIVTQLKSLPFLSGATFIEKDFSDAGVSQYLQDNEITLLPAITLNSNQLNDGGQISGYLTALSDGNYSLALPSAFNPFAKRSDKGFQLLEDKQSAVDEIKAESTIDGNPEAAITWIEYSDVQCPYCAKLHNDGTPDTVKAKYGDKINVVFQHFPLDFHASAQKGAEWLECIAEQNPSVLFPVIAAIYKKYPNQDVTIDGLKDIAAENNINKDELTTCIDSGKYADKVKNQMNRGQSTFGVTGTPGNVIINNVTGEYEVISGAYPASAFEAIIDRMLAE